MGSGAASGGKWVEWSALALCRGQRCVLAPKPTHSAKRKRHDRPLAERHALLLHSLKHALDELVRCAIPSSDHNMRDRVRGRRVNPLQDDIAPDPPGVLHALGYVHVCGDVEALEQAADVVVDDWGS